MVRRKGRTQDEVNEQVTGNRRQLLRHGQPRVVPGPISHTAEAEDYHVIFSVIASHRIAVMTASPHPPHAPGSRVLLSYFITLSR